MLNVRKSSPRANKAPRAAVTKEEQSPVTKASKIENAVPAKEAKVEAELHDQAPDFPANDEWEENETRTNVAPSYNPAHPTSIVVDKGVPVPETRGGGGKQRYPWELLEVGDSFFAPGKIETFYTNTSAAGKRLGRKFIARKWEERGVQGVRVWRTH